MRVENIESFKTINLELEKNDWYGHIDVLKPKYIVAF